MDTTEDIGDNLSATSAAGPLSVASPATRWQGCVALVTGASSGIGAAIAIRLASMGMKVYGCGRRVAKISALEVPAEGSGSIAAVKCDLTREEDIAAMFERIRCEQGRLDVLVNNAGVCVSAPLLSGETSVWQTMLAVNVVAPALCTRLAVDAMDSAGVTEGHIININSLSGHRVAGSKQSNFYAATKFSLGAITESVRAELRQRQSRIRVSQVSPGVTQTPFHQKALGGKPAKRLLRSMHCLQAADIADTVAYILNSPPHVQVADVLMRCTEQAS